MFCKMTQEWDNICKNLIIATGNLSVKRIVCKCYQRYQHKLHCTAFLRISKSEQGCFTIHTKLMILNDSIVSWTLGGIVLLLWLLTTTFLLFLLFRLLLLLHL